MSQRTDNFKIIREILTRIESQMDKPVIDWSQFSAESLNMSAPRWLRIMSALSEDGLIRGFSYSGDASDPLVNIGDISLTLQGLEYVAKKIKYGVRNLTRPLAGFLLSENN